MLIGIGITILAIVIILGVLAAGIGVLLLAGGSVLGGWLIFKGLTKVGEIVE